MTLIAAIFLVTLISGAVLTGQVRRYALKRNIVDFPNERGLHADPMPRGGGAAILVVVSVCLIVLQGTGLVDQRMALIWVTCGFGFGLLGWIDDRTDLSALTRLMFQLFLAAAFIVAVFVEPGAASPWWMDPRLLFGPIIASFASAWLVNLYNFMDGADGFAASEAVAVGSAGAVISGVSGSTETMLLAVAITGATAGFLVWNWQPARIFLGDVGSYFLGFQFCALITHDIYFGLGPWMWLILLVPFITDASLTLFTRIVARKRWWQAHRSHLYQLLILRGHSHAAVSSSLIIGTLTVLFPLAWLSVARPQFAPELTLTVYALAGTMWTIFCKQLNR